MTLKISDRELERLLRGEPGADLRPPEGLLARLRADLPAELPHDLPPAPPAAAPDNVLRPIWGSRTLLSLAATLAVVAGASFLALRTFREMPPAGVVAFEEAKRDQVQEAPAAAPQVGMASAVAEVDAEEDPALKKEAEAAPVVVAETPPAPQAPPSPPASRPAPARIAAPKIAPAAEPVQKAFEPSLEESSRRLEPQPASAAPPPSAVPAEARGEAGGVPGGVPGGTAGGYLGRNSYDEIRVVPVDELDDKSLRKKLEAGGAALERRADPAATATAGEGKAKDGHTAALQATELQAKAGAAFSSAADDQPIDLRDEEGRRRARQLQSPTVQGDAPGPAGPPPAAAAAPREPRAPGRNTNAEAWDAIEKSLASGIWPSFALIDAARQPSVDPGRKAAGRDADAAADPVLKLREDCLDFFGKMEKNRSDLTPLRRRSIRLASLRPDDPRLTELVRLLNLASHILPD